MPRVGPHDLRPARKELLAADVEAQLTAPTTQWAEAKQLKLSATVSRAALPGRTNAPTHWGFWTNLAPWQIETSVALDGVKSELKAFELAQLRFTTHWRAPSLSITNLHIALYGGALDTHAQLDVETRRVAASGAFDFDAYRIQHLFDANTQRELSNFKFAVPPKAKARVALVLPAWTNRAPDWKPVGESVTLAARVETQAGGYRGATFLEASSDLTLTNGLLRLPNLWARRPEGRRGSPTW